MPLRMWFCYNCSLKRLTNFWPWFPNHRQHSHWDTEILMTSVLPCNPQNPNISLNMRVRFLPCAWQWDWCICNESTIFSCQKLKEWTQILLKTPGLFTNILHYCSWKTDTVNMFIFKNPQYLSKVTGFRTRQGCHLSKCKAADSRHKPLTEYSHSGAAFLDSLRVIQHVTGKDSAIISDFGGENL